ncbi:hypothetical protein D7Y07_01545 [Bacteroides acidifaciens]|uniref:Uncharacterized protein n=2 Tax=Bacteroides acidifaciens TaxID=85831 RepID=A0A3L8ACY0_9BACE|nr:hypothetical protein D7Y07_01545 [Bacteroides acidifaciens]
MTRNLLTPLNKKLKKMTKSALQIARAAYQPKLPKVLASGAVKAVAGAALHLLPDTDAVVGFVSEYIFCFCEKH